MRTYPVAVGEATSAATSSTQIIDLLFNDAAAATNPQTVWTLLNTAIVSWQARYISYCRPGNMMYLTSDNSDTCLDRGATLVLLRERIILALTPEQQSVSPLAVHL